MKRALVITLALMMTLALIAGCGRKDDGQTDVTVQQSNSGVTDSEQKQDNSEASVEGTSTVSADQIKEIYLDFIRGNNKMTVKNSSIGWFEEGKEYSYDEMCSAFAGDFTDMFADVVLNNACYAFIDCGADGVPELIISQEYTFEYDTANLYSIFKYIDGKVCCVSSQYGYYRSFVSVNEYGYICNGGSGGAALYYQDNSFINKDGEEVFLYSESDEMAMSDAYIPIYSFPGHEAPEGYPEDLYQYSDEGNYYTCVTYNFTQYQYVEDGEDEEYYKNNFYTFYDEDGIYAAPDAELEKIYKDNGIKFYTTTEADQMVKEHEASLGVTDQIRDGNDIEWISFLSLGIGSFKQQINGYYALMSAVPGKWKMKSELLADGIKEIYMSIEESGEFAIDVSYTDDYSAPGYAKGHLVITDDKDYYTSILEFYPEKSNMSNVKERSYMGVYGIADYTVSSDKISMELYGDDGIKYFFEDFTKNGVNPVFEKAYSDQVYDSYTVLYNPSEDYYYSPYDEEQTEASAVELKQISCVENDITDDDVWFGKLGIPGYSDNYSDDKYIYKIGGLESYGRKTILYIYDKNDKKLLYTFDFHNFIFADNYEYNYYVDRSIRYAEIKDNVLYVNLYHSTYADSCPYNAYVMAIDLTYQGIIWKSEPLVSNSDNFIILGDNIITGYGFTAEDHYISILDRNTGKLLKKVPVKKSPEYFYLKDNILYVRTYSYDYEFEVSR